ncbi:MAG TPA: DegV family protein [Rhodospirillales bacterium]
MDEINVFPVADGDTGRNLKLSLAPLGRNHGSVDRQSRQLVTSATGNSGNIAVAFLAGFLSAADCRHLDRAVAIGRDAAWRAVANPRSGTMLTVFDALDRAMQSWPDAPAKSTIDGIVESLAAAVRSTPDLLAELKRAGVIDAGALGMFIFFEGLFRHLVNDAAQLVPIDRRFSGLLKVTGKVDPLASAGYCVHTVFKPLAETDVCSLAAGLGESVVAVADGDRLRVHVHTHNQGVTRARLESLGTVDDWQVESLVPEASAPWVGTDSQAIHVMTDAAGSLTRAQARRLGITLLDSYLIVDDRRIPETLFDAGALYCAMAAGIRVSTAQASVFQQHQSYQSALGRHEHVLYLTVGSAYTGNFATASRWRRTSDCADRFNVLDTGAASGRLGLLGRLVACFARDGQTPAAVSAFARRAMARCDELIFLDQLKFLAAGGRISRSKGFFGDLLGIKPVIRSAADGAVKVGAVRKDADQVPFALDYLTKRFSREERLTILLQFSDNAQRVREQVQPAMARQFPQARIKVGPLSLTSGAHMGPGTWGVAFCPHLNDFIEDDA